MKNITNYILALLLVIATSSCHDESLNPHPDVDFVGMVRSEVFSPPASQTYLDLSSPDDLIDILVTAPENDVDSFSLMAKIRVNNEWVDPVPLKTISSFPEEIKIKASDIINTFSDYTITHGMQFIYYGVSTSNGYTIDLDAVTGQGFDPGDNPDGVISGYTAAYQLHKYYLKNP